MSRSLTRLMSAVVVSAGLAALAGCGGDRSAGTGTGAVATFPMTVANCGRQVTIEHPPRRILADRNTSTIVAAAGAADRIVARSGEGDAPLGSYAPALARVPQLTPNSGDPPPREVVLGQGVDLVVVGHTDPEYVRSLEAAGVDVLVPLSFCSQIDAGAPAPTLDDTYRTLDTFGRVFGTRDIAQRSIDDLRRRVTAVEQRVRGGAPRTAANIYLGTGVLQVYGAPSLNNAVMRTLGLTNVFADSNERTADVNVETLLARDPDVVIVSYGSNYGISNGADALRALRDEPALNGLRAVRDQRVIALNYSYLTGGPLVVDGLEMLATQLAGLS